ncbi:MAG: 2-oxoacid:acceptor oxidoreductase subunit alpha [Phycisphaerales bacterium]|nr:2-oxoacid:acceptor oxidoreductase subunit alpha [Phycisphaerales bacterium]
MVSGATTETHQGVAKNREVQTLSLDHVTIRLAGDSGDGMQLAGTQLTNTSALVGNDISTLPDFPAEIRAPAGSLAGVSGFQLNFSRETIHTPGDGCDVLVAMNPAALKANIEDLVDKGTLIVNDDAFNAGNLQKAGYDHNPLESGELARFRVFRVPVDKLTIAAAKESGLGTKAVLRTKNFFALGLVYWMYGRPLETTLGWIDAKFKKVPAVVEANVKALKAGYYYGETTEAFTVRYEVERAKIAPGTYRKITGNEAVAIGMIAAARQADKTLFYGSYPITPASDILHELAMYPHFHVKTFQAEDEIAAMTSCIGAAYGGALAATGTSGPGLALKGEALGLAVMTELPMVIVDVQRGGPSTGLPTKTEQADLFQALFGRNGECPIPVVAPSTPGDCFTMTVEAFRIAMKYMTPVLVLSDGYLANGAEPWAIPNVKDLPDLRVQHPTGIGNGNGEHFLPYQRNDHLGRPWALPGTRGLQHRIGGLEKQDITGNVSYDPENHEHMCRTRAAKVAGIATDIPLLPVEGPARGDLLVLGWGGTYGAIVSAVQRAQARGLSVASAHLRYLNPLPRNVGEVLKAYKKVLIPELNLGQLAMVIRARFLVDAVSYTKVQGKPFRITDIENKIDEMLKGA